MPRLEFGWSELYMVRSDRYKYIRRYDGRDRLVLPNVDDAISKEYLLTQGWEEQPRDQEMLFDLVFDPFECDNLVAEPRTAEVLGDLRGRLDDWMQRTDDPLLPDGRVPPPPGSKVNDPDGRSPGEEPVCY